MLATQETVLTARYWLLALFNCACNRILGLHFGWVPLNLLWTVLSQTLHWLYSYLVKKSIGTAPMRCPVQWSSRWGFILVKFWKCLPPKADDSRHPTTGQRILLLPRVTLLRLLPGELVLWGWGVSLLVSIFLITGTWARKKGVYRVVGFHASLGTFWQNFFTRTAFIWFLQYIHGCRVILLGLIWH